MAQAMVLGLTYSAMEGNILIFEAETIFIGAEVRGGQFKVGVSVEVNPATESIVTFQDKIAEAVRAASASVPTEAGGDGVVIPDAELLLPYFVKG